MEGTGLKSTSVLVSQLLGSLTYSDLWLAMAFLGLIANPNSLNREYNLPLAAHSSPPPSCPPLTHATCDITVAVKHVAQNTKALAS